jgi:hypothetical protein
LLDLFYYILGVRLLRDLLGKKKSETGKALAEQQFQPNIAVATDWAFGFLFELDGFIGMY